MPRPKCKRRIARPPTMEGFRPFGIQLSKAESVVLFFEEYEAIRLTDYEGLTQEQASEQMQVSRPTFTRIYEKARRSIAKAFIEGKTILIQEGDAKFENQWFRCKRCHKLVEGLANHTPCKNCPCYGEEELTKINQ